MDVSTVVTAAPAVLEGWSVDLVQVLMLIVISLLGFGARQFVAWLKSKSDLSAAEQEAMQCLLEGMAAAQEALIREAKAAAADGKLTKDEITKAESLALRHAQEVATGPAKDIVMSWTARRASSLIKQLLAKLKSGKKGVASGDNTANSVSTDTPAS